MNTVLFLCTGNYYRSRFAEILFNWIATEKRMLWRAESRGMALERGVHNVGPISNLVIKRVRSLGIQVNDDRSPMAVKEHDFRKASYIVAVKELEHKPLLERQFPRWIEKVEFWNVDDLDCSGPEKALGELESKVRRLLMNLLESSASYGDGV